MKRAATALLAMTMAAGCGDATPPPPASPPIYTAPGCDAGEALVMHPAPTLPACEAVDGGADADAATAP
jgi:hypothetical protein